MSFTDSKRLGTMLRNSRIIIRHKDFPPCVSAEVSRPSLRLETQLKFLSVEEHFPFFSRPYPIYQSKIPLDLHHSSWLVPSKDSRSPPLIPRTPFSSSNFNGDTPYLLFNLAHLSLWRPVRTLYQLWYLIFLFFLVIGESWHGCHCFQYLDWDPIKSPYIKQQIRHRSLLVSLRCRSVFS